MKSQRVGTVLRHLAAILSIILLTQAVPAFSQQPPADADQPPLLTPNQLEDLVAPIALYPDPLLSQVLVASTYPLEVVEAYQWLQRNPGLTGPSLTQAAEQQNWDPSVQALVVFPDVMKQLSSDVTWITNLGNAFLQQEDDVMSAVQSMRAKAQQAGKLNSSSQQQVTTSMDAGQPEIIIEPASPDVIYVPVYDPAWIWGPPIYYPYPRWYYPPRRGADFLFFGGPIRIGFFFGSGWGGWGGWGWHPGWGSHTVVVNNVFIHRYNFNSAHVSNLGGTSVWSHDSSHRLGVPYPSRGLNEQFRAGVRENLRSPRDAAPTARPDAARPAPGAERLGNREIAPNAPNRNHTAFGSIEHGSNSSEQLHTDHGYSSLGPNRPAASPQAARPAAPAPQVAPAPPRQEPPHAAPPQQRSAPAARSSSGRGGSGSKKP